jgi:hypothetical protein
MGFEEFEPHRSSSSGRGTPTVRLLSGGRFSFNAAGARLFEGYADVELAFDRDLNKIAFRRVSKATEHSFRITTASSAAIVTAKEFAQKYGILPGGRMRLAKEDDLIVTSTTEASLDDTEIGT